MSQLGVGLYGQNGHQIQEQLKTHPRAQLTAVAGFDPARVAAGCRVYPTLDELLQDDRVQLVSLCAPRRRDQAADAIHCLAAGKHVYAEKPCALCEADLEAIVAAARASGCQFHEMAGTAFAQPFRAMRQLVRDGVIGTVVQVFAQKSYPYFDGRPQDEDVDGGLLCQAGVHAVRFVEHVAGVRIKDADAVETQLGNPRPGALRMAATLMAWLENGGVACVVVNYLNQSGLGHWGNDQLRIFGTAGMVEAVDGATRTRLIVGKEDRGPLDLSAPSQDYFDMFVASVLDGTPMPLSVDEELHPTRVVLQAKQRAGQNAIRPQPRAAGSRGGRPSSSRPS